jgi:cytochrome c-type biogenesis protein CcmF
MKNFSQGVLISLGIGIALTIGGVFLFKITNPMLVIFMAAGFFALVANLLYAIIYLRKHGKQMGASIAHMGFALMLLGVLVSSAKKQVITADFSGNMRNFQEEMRKENMLLLKGQKERLGDFWVTYQGDSISGEDIYFKVHYKAIEGDEEFTLLPNTQIGESQNLLPNPDTRHYMTYDVYTHITSLPKPMDSIEWRNVREVAVKPGDSVVTTNGTIYFTGIEQGSGDDIGLKNTQLVKAKLIVKSAAGEFETQPIFGINEHTTFSLREELEEPGLRLAFDIRPDENNTQAFLEIAETDPQPKFIVMKAIVFPYINLLWLGTIMMVFGFALAAFNRLELKRG